MENSTILTRLQATTPQGSVTNFNWKLEETRKALKVICNYGGGTDTSNVATALIPWNSSSSVPVEPADNPAITVTGSVNAQWYNAGYNVSFSGQMNCPGYINMNAEPCLVGYSKYGSVAEAAMKK